jgi:hypothetical protein
VIDKVREPWKAFVESPSGTGNWHAFKVPFEQVVAAADEWKRIVEGHRKLWLCWNVNDAWCLLQQKLVAEVGWTPVVGWDPMCGVGRPPMAPGALCIDFNAAFGIPSMFMHVPLELAFLWIEDKLAFWHSDLILPRSTMKYLADVFAALDDREMAAVYSYGEMENWLRPSEHRYWELCGCTTRAASQDQFDKGSGWWKNIAFHPNAPQESAEQRRRRSLRREHGIGIRYWEKHYGGKVRRISGRRISSGHFSAMSKKPYTFAATKAEEMSLNFDLTKIARDFGIDDLSDIPLTRGMST